MKELDPTILTLVRPTHARSEGFMCSMSHLYIVHSRGPPGLQVSSIQFMLMT
jgi:hypothetical protein